MPDGSREPVAVERVYSLLTVKSINEEKRIIEGIATTPMTDRMGDIVESQGMKFKLPLPFLMQHDASPDGSIGFITDAKVTKDGIQITARVERDPLLPELDKAWARIKKGLVRGLSIGFRSLEDEPIDPKNPFFGGTRFVQSELMEISAVVIPANAQANIQTIKSLAAAAPGRQAAGRSPPPGASGTSKPASAGFFSPRGKGTNMSTSIEQQVSGLRDTRQTKASRIQELDAARVARGEDAAFSDEERTELRGLSADVQNIDDQIAVKQAQVVDMRSARPVDPAIASRGTPYGFVRKADPDDKFKGQAETRRIIVRALSHISMKQGDFKSAAQIAEERYGRTHPNLVAVMKSGVTGGGSGSGETWAELVAMDGRFTGDFVEFLYSRTVYDQLGLRDVPANVTIKGQDAAATGYFIGESKGIPASSASGSTVNLTPLKVGAISVCSNELLADSTPAAEMLVRDSLVQAASQKIDTVFLSASAASAGVSPAGILNGLSAGGSAGNTPTHVMADIQALLANFISGKYTSELVIVTTPTNAAALGMMTNSLGFPAFPNSQITQKGGTFQGYRVVTGHNVTANNVLMLSPMDIWKIGDSGIQVSVSQEAMIEQDTSPQGATDTPASASATLTSMFQEESTAFKIVRRINWKLRRSDAVAYIGDASYNLGS